MCEPAFDPGPHRGRGPPPGEGGARGPRACPERSRILPLGGGEPAGPRGSVATSLVTELN